MFINHIWIESSFVLLCIKLLIIFRIKSLWTHIFSFSMNRYFKSGIAVLCFNCMFNFIGNCQIAFQYGRTIWISLSSLYVPVASYSPTLDVVSLLNFNHSSGWGVVSYYGFNLYFCHFTLNIFLVLSFFKCNFKKSSFRLTGFPGLSASFPESLTY